MSYQREFGKKLKIGLVGIGSHSYRNLLPCFHYLPVELAAICNRSDAAKAETTAAEYGCRYYQNTGDMYKKEKLDAVFICVSPQAHPALVKEAMDAGLHVWVEKPPAMRSFEIEELLEAQSEQVVLIGYKKVFMPTVQKALELIRSEKYGGLEGMCAIYPMTIPEHGAEILEQRQFTNWLGNGCHPLSVMLACCGKAEAVTVHRTASGHGSCHVEFANGVFGSLQLAAGPIPLESYQFFAEGWHYLIENSSKATLQRGIPFKYGRTTSFISEGDDRGAVVWEPQHSLATLENKALFIQGIYSSMLHFCECILEHKQPMFGDLEFALEVTKVYEAALLSEGKRIRIND